MKTIIKYWPKIYSTITHPTFIGMVLLLSSTAYNDSEIRKLYLHIAACSIIAAGLVRK